MVPLLWIGNTNGYRNGQSGECASPPAFRSREAAVQELVHK